MLIRTNLRLKLPAASELKLKSAGMLVTSQQCWPTPAARSSDCLLAHAASRRESLDVDSAGFSCCMHITGRSGSVPSGDRLDPLCGRQMVLTHRRGLIRETVSVFVYTLCFLPGTFPRSKHNCCNRVMLYTFETRDV